MTFLKRWRNPINMLVLAGCFTLAGVAYAEVYQGEPQGAQELAVVPSASENCKKHVKAPAPRSYASPDAQKILPPKKGVYAGLYSIESTKQDYLLYQERSGQFPPILYSFHDWLWDENWGERDPPLRSLSTVMEDRNTTPIKLAKEIAKNGTVLALGWALQCCDWASMTWWFGFSKTDITVPRLLAGEFDDYIRKVATEVKALQLPIMLAPFTEFNWQGVFAFGTDGVSKITEVDNICGEYGDPSWPDGPERIRDAYRHIIDIFRAEEVLNVTWFMYANSGYMSPSRDEYSVWLHPKYFYPGDAYIDWVGQSVYFIDPSWGKEISDDSSDIDSALKAGYDAWGEVTQRPMFLPEFGAAGDETTDRSAIIKEVMENYLPKFPRIKAFTLADFLVAELCCKVPRLGRHFPAEKEVWKQSVTSNPYYSEKIRIGSP